MLITLILAVLLIVFFITVYSVDLGTNTAKSVTSVYTGTAATPFSLQWSKLGSRVRITHYLTVYQCPICQFETTDQKKYCPHCARQGKKEPLQVNLKERAI